MAQELNATCKICGKPYHYCKDCEKFGSWRAVACSPECWTEWVNRITARNTVKENADDSHEEAAPKNVRRVRKSKTPVAESEKAEK